MVVEARLEEPGLVLPEPLQAPPGLVLPFSWVRVRENRAYVSGYISLNPDGSPHRAGGPRQPQASSGRPGPGGDVA